MAIILMLMLMPLLILNLTMMLMKIFGWSVEGEKGAAI